MKLSARGEYACLAMIDLAKHFGGGFIRISDISRRMSIPSKFLEQILLTLNRAGYLVSKRGSRGGYKLVKNPCDISVAEIVRLFDGRLAPVGSVSRFFFSHTPVEQCRELLLFFKEIRDVVAYRLENTSFGDLL